MTSFRARARCAAVWPVAFAAAALTASPATAVTLHVTKAAFDASASTTILSDFEGIVADTGVQVSPTITVDGAVYSASPNNVQICGKDICSGNPFDSAALASSSGDAIEIDLTGLGFAVTAVGGIFGDLNGPAGTSATIEVIGSGGSVLGSFAVNVGDMGQGLAKTFFGFNSPSATIEKIRYDMAGSFEAVDDLQFGVSTIPAPLGLPLLLGALFLARAPRLRRGR